MSSKRPYTHRSFAAALLRMTDVVDGTKEISSS
jgi:hypothetical protein